MKIDDELRVEILKIDTVAQAVRLLRAYAEEEPELKKTIQEVTYGINQRFHYNKYETNMYTIKEKSGYITFKDGTTMTLEQLWDEIDERIGHAIHELLTYFQDEEPFEGRT
jgi:hypothetical protein